MVAWNKRSRAMGQIIRFWRDQGGVTAIEYCLIAGIISVAIVAGATSIGTNINRKFFGPLMSGLN